MANEVRVVEQQTIRGHTPIMVAPFLAVQTLSIAGAVSAAFNNATSMVSVYTNTTCQIEFSALNGTAPDGAGAGSDPIPLPAGQWLHFSVRPGDKIIAVA